MAAAAVDALSLESESPPMLPTGAALQPATKANATAETLMLRMISPGSFE
jgi:hypothetical protein